MGRPATFGQPAAASIRIRITVAQRRDLEQVARDNRSNLAAVIREAVNEYVADYREGAPVFRGPKR